MNKRSIRHIDVSEFSHYVNSAVETVSSVICQQTTLRREMVVGAATGYRPDTASRTVLLSLTFPTTAVFYHILKKINLSANVTSADDVTVLHG